MKSMPRRCASPSGTPSRIKSFVFIHPFASDFMLKELHHDITGRKECPRGIHEDNVPPSGAGLEKRAKQNVCVDNDQRCFHTIFTWRNAACFSPTNRP